MELPSDLVLCNSSSHAYSLGYITELLQARDFVQFCVLRLLVLSSAAISLDSPFVEQPPIFTADFAFNVIFGVLSLGQIMLVLLLTGIKMARKPWRNDFGTVTEQEVVLLRLHRPRFALLMALALISLVIVYSTQAASMFYGFIPYPTYLAIFVANNCFWDIQNVFFSAVLIAVLDSGIKVSQLRRHGSTANAWQVGTDVNIIVMSCLVGVLMVLTIARIAVFGLWNAEETGTGPSATTAAERWAQFGLSQVRLFIDVVLAIYYTVVAILMWRKVYMVPAGPNEADKDYSFRVLKASHPETI
ncbi:hypothetical protein JOM56_000888 [Amanita muscaria]